MRSRPLALLLVLAVSVAMLATGCPAEPDEEEEIGAVSVVGVWGGGELESFQEVVAGWEEETGGEMRFEGTRDLSAILRSRIAGGNPPDLAILPNPALMQEFGEAGDLIPLEDVLDNMDQFREDYAEQWVELGSVDGTLYGVFVKAAPKSTVWYSPPDFEEQGYEIPESWDDLVALTNQIREQDDVAPWSMGFESGGASGWPGADWIAEILLAESGPEVYDQWVDHEIPWTHEAVRSAFERFGEIANTEGNVEGGASAIVGTNFEDASYGPFQDPPRSRMYFLGAFTQGFIESQFPDLEPEQGYDFFDFPPIDEQYANAVTVGGDVVVMLNDTPSARSLLEYLADGENWRPWAEAGGFTTASAALSEDAYPDPVAVKAADQLAEADPLRFGAGDAMPAEVQSAFWQGVLDYVQNPGNLDSILQRIESVAEDAYGAQEGEGAQEETPTENGGGE
ncbi:MAG: carbohydrate ABC transporter substrate-binding protein [Coriobacteriia bacterium]|nr:carbohydrate ABC transporter substrate-binding protein [Coriobacteriia bacterium]